MGVGDVARRNEWAAACSVDAVVPRADQFGESDLHFITRLARMHGATATVKAGKLIVTPRGAGKSASGKPLPAITLARSDVGHYEVSFPDRASFAAVHTERHAFGSAEAAKLAASARLRSQRGQQG
ncbi:hypothetical protein RO07_04035 [Pandoraea pulmonicola]|uniref:Uncharacterized protein n=1 Tax=Pandoraea pulmonicola TaxID=93221 RepID=A0ABM6FSY1_PANPU|nr:hypothetical protein RO07_04035 [Pandoraea pulmonicola]